MKWEQWSFPIFMSIVKVIEETNHGRINELSLNNVSIPMNGILKIPGNFIIWDGIWSVGRLKIEIKFNEQFFHG